MSLFVWNPGGDHLQRADPSQLNQLIKEGLIPIKNGFVVQDHLETYPDTRLLDLRVKMKEAKIPKIMRDDFGDEFEYEVDAYWIEEIDVQDNDMPHDTRSIEHFVDDRSVPKLHEMNIFTVQDFYDASMEEVIKKVPFITAKTYTQLLSRMGQSGDEDLPTGLAELDEEVKQIEEDSK